jgi:hypothetical protein
MEEKKMEELDLNEDLVLKGLKKTTKAMRIADLVKHFNFSYKKY